jgi:two-component system, cell cycle sensor histidine kinase and response regulator CckA
MPASSAAQVWKYIRGLALPVLVLTGLVAWLGYALYARVHFWQQADEYNLREWLNEATTFRKTLPDLVREYLADPDAIKAEVIEEHLKDLGIASQRYPERLPLFPRIYRLEVRFLEPKDDMKTALGWESNLPRPSTPERGPGQGVLEYRLLGDADGRAIVRLEYQLHAYNKRQRDEEQRQALSLAVAGLAVAAAVLAGIWVWLFLRRQRERELHELRQQQQIEHAERQLLEKELHRQEAERKQEETEHALLEQRFATQAAERQALELKSQLYANIGIMAGSYAHNIKNLLVRPNDLLRRCLDANGLSSDQQHILHEVRHTLGTVTERLQQILRTVRRDPSRSELVRLDLNQVAADIRQTWEQLALEKWKLTLSVELHPEPLWIVGDISHLQQAAENLIFNARDATFEMRGQLREQARKQGSVVKGQGSDEERVRQGLIAAAGWKGLVVLRTRREGDEAILEVQDNGIGMTDPLLHQARQRAA